MFAPKRQTFFYFFFMNVIVVPDAAMIVIPLIEKNGHTYLSPSNFSKYDNTDIIDETGRVKNAPAVATTVGYTITVSVGSTTKSIKLYSVVPGTTSWQKWDGRYPTATIWNEGNFGKVF